MWIVFNHLYIPKSYLCFLLVSEKENALAALVYTFESEWRWGLSSRSSQISCFHIKREMNVRNHNTQSGGCIKKGCVIFQLKVPILVEGNEVAFFSFLHLGTWENILCLIENTRFYSLPLVWKVYDVVQMQLCRELVGCGLRSIRKTWNKHSSIAFFSIQSLMYTLSCFN